MSQLDRQLGIFPFKHEGFTFSLFMESDITPEYMTWLNDTLHMRYSQQAEMVHTPETSKAYLESFQGTPNLFLSINHKSTFVGTSTIYINEYGLQGNIGIMIGREHAHKGLGKRIWKILVELIAPRIGLREVIAGTRVDNSAMISLFEAAHMERIRLLESGLTDELQNKYVEYRISY